MSDIEFFGIALPLLVAELGVIVTALSAIVGIWIERDRERPIKKPVALTVLVIFAGSLCMYQAWHKENEQDELEAQLAKILEELDHVAIHSEVELPDLNDALKSEFLVHGRANPKVLMDLAKSIAAKGGDPLKMLAAYLPEADLQAMKRDGKFDEALADPKVATAEGKKRPKLVFGSNSNPFVRNENSDAADAGVPDAAVVTNDSVDGGASDAGAVADALLDAGADAATTATTTTTTNASTERESLKRQIEEARRQVAAAKTWQEKREPQRRLFELLGALDKVEKAAGSPSTAGTGTTTTPATSASAPKKKPKIEIEEDDTP